MQLPLSAQAQKTIACAFTYAICAFCAMAWITYPTTHTGHIICWVSALVVMFGTNYIAYSKYGRDDPLWSKDVILSQIATVLVFMTWLLPPKKVFNDVLFTPFEFLTFITLSFPLVFLSHK